jgi:hypothetical protein
MEELIAISEVTLIMQLIVVVLQKFVLREYSPLWRSRSWRVMRIILIESYIVPGTSAGRHLICRPRGGDGMHLMLPVVWLRCQGKLVAEERKGPTALGMLTSPRERAASVMKEVQAYAGGMHAFNYSISRCFRCRNRRIGELNGECVKILKALPLNRAVLRNHGEPREDALTDGRFVGV